MYNTLTFLSHPQYGFRIRKSGPPATLTLETPEEKLIRTSVCPPEVSLAGIRLSDCGAEFKELFSFPSEFFPFG